MKLLILLAFFSSDIQALGSDDYLTRERAEARLTRFGDLVYPLLEINYKDAERNRRTKRIAATVIPTSYPPIALLGTSYTLEWGTPNDYAGYISPRREDESHFIMWIRPTSSVGWRSFLVQHYGEKARTQYCWKEWHSTSDSCHATNIMVRDLKMLGVPAFLIRKFIYYLNHKEINVMVVHKNSK